MSQIDDSWTEEKNRIPEVEPLPFIDYNLIKRIKHIPASKLNKREIDGFDSLIAARTQYYSTHNKFQYEYNGLHDAKIYDTMLRAQETRLKDMGKNKDADSRAKLRWTRINIPNNEKDLDACLEKVRVRWRTWIDAAEEFKRKKAEFVETMLPGFMAASEQPEVKALLESSSAAAAAAARLLATPSSDYETSFTKMSTPTPSPETIIASPNSHAKENMEHECVVDPQQTMELDEIQGEGKDTAGRKRKIENPLDDLDENAARDEVGNRPPKIRASTNLGAQKAEEKKDPPHQQQQQQQRFNPFGEWIISVSDLWREHLD